jgi:hypothetical protein
VAAGLSITFAVAACNQPAQQAAADYILSKPDRCNPSKTVAAVERAGYYPTVSCVRYDTARDTYNVSMEEFVLRERSDPGPPALLAPPTLTSSNR